MNLAFQADGYDISIDVSKTEEETPKQERRFRVGFCLPEKADGSR